VPINTALQTNKQNKQTKQTKQNKTKFLTMFIKIKTTLINQNNNVPKPNESWNFTSRRIQRE
jgi:dolichyl-phosphate-mannose--protein O-mannosyl transferase